MTAANVAIDHGAPTRAKYGSMSRDRRWALRWSYFFLVLFCIFLVRIMDSYIPGGVWVVYLLLGGLFTLGGLLLWQQARKRPAREH